MTMHYQSERQGGCVVPPDIDERRDEGAEMEPQWRRKERRKSYRKAFYAAVREFEALGRDPGEGYADLQEYCHARARETIEGREGTCKDPVEREARRIAGQAEKLKSAASRRMKNKIAVKKEAMIWQEKVNKLFEAWNNGATDELACIHANVEGPVLAFALAHSQELAGERNRRIKGMTIKALNNFSLAVDRGERWAVEKRLEIDLPDQFGRKPDDDDGRKMLKGAMLGFSLAGMIKSAETEERKRLAAPIIEATVTETKP